MDNPEIITSPKSFKRSESIAALSASLAKAQGEIQGAAKDKDNPYFKSKYADLASVWEACRKPLSENGLSIMQFPRTTDMGIEVETILSHSSGEWVSEVLALPVAKSDAQGIGSAITYARRYALAAFVGVAPEDDDGNAAAKSAQGLREKVLATLEMAATKGAKQLELTWKGLNADARKTCMTVLAGLKAKATEVDNAATQS